MVREMQRFGDYPLREVVSWATWNGAEALGLQNEIGSVEVGRKASIILIEGIEQRDGELWMTQQTKTRRLC